MIDCDAMSIVNWELGHSTARINRMADVIRFLGYNSLSTNGTIAERLVSHRKSHGLTQKELARELGIDPSTLARWERGERKPTGTFLMKIITEIDPV